MELWKENTANRSAFTSILETPPELPEEGEADRVVAALRRGRIRTMLVRALCKSLDADEQR